MGAKLKVAGILAVGAVAGALTTMQLQANARNSLSPLPLEELQQLAAVFGMVKSDYVEPVDEKKLISDAIGGMVAGLDPHSQYFDKKSWKEFRESTGGKFVGIGIEMGMEDGLVKVVSPIEGSPAFRVGLKPGDLIRSLDRLEPQPEIYTTYSQQPRIIPGNHQGLRLRGRKLLPGESELSHSA